MHALTHMMHMPFECYLLKVIVKRRGSCYSTPQEYALSFLLSSVRIFPRTVRQILSPQCSLKKRRICSTEGIEYEHQHQIFRRGSLLHTRNP